MTSEPTPDRLDTPLEGVLDALRRRRERLEDRDRPRRAVTLPEPGSTAEAVERYRAERQARRGTTIDPTSTH